MLCDFGRSRIIDQRGFTTKFAGAARYMAPELITDDSDHPPVTLATDVYTFAIVGAEVNISIVWIELYLKFDHRFLMVDQHSLDPTSI